MTTFKVVQGFGDGNDRSKCWEVETVQVFSCERKANEFAETIYDLQIENLIDYKSFWVNVERKEN